MSRRRASQAPTWEKVVRKLRTGMMPPAGAPRPERATLDGFAAAVEAALDRAAAAAPNPGAPALHRLNRTEYANAVRDLLDLPIDAAALLPADDSSDGFDNIASVLSVSPALMQGYVSAAVKISRLAVGDPTHQRRHHDLSARRAGLSQDEHIEGLPLGTRGGILVQHIFPLDAEYEFSVGRAGGGCSGCRRSAPTSESRSRSTASGCRCSDATRRAVHPAQDSRRPARRSASPSSASANARGVDDLFSELAQQRRRAAAWRSTGRSTRPGLATRRAAAGSSSAGPADGRAKKRRARGRSWRRSPRARCDGRSPERDPTIDDADGVLSSPGRDAARLRDRHSVRAGARARRSAVHLPLRARAGRACAPARSTASATSSWRRGCRSSCGAASRTMSCSTLAAKGRLARPGGARAAGAAHARRPDGRTRSSTTSPASGCSCASSTTSAPGTKEFDDNLRQAFRRETELLFETIVREDRSVARPARRRLHVRGRAARAALRHSRTSAAAASGASRSTATARAAACSARAAS